jgi:hypothetical protein
VRGNADNPSLEFNWGSPGRCSPPPSCSSGRATTLADSWTESATALERWRGDLWEQDLYGHRTHIIGPAHGFAGNVYVSHAATARRRARATLERRAVATLDLHALRARRSRSGVLARAEPRPTRTQWCHGAPGIVASLASLAPRDDELTDLLVAGGEPTWARRPLRKGAGLCHGTAGKRLRVPQAPRAHGRRALAAARARIRDARESNRSGTRPRCTAAGDTRSGPGIPGTALYLASCLEPDPAFPTLDVW